MKHWIACLLLLAALFTTGCDTVNHTQIQILPPTVERGGTAVATVPASERAAVKQVLTDIATRLRFEDRTEMSLVPETICSFSQVDVKYPMSIKAWVSKDRVSIDLFQRPPGAGEPEAYRKLREQVLSELKKQFGPRLTQIHKMDQITPQSAPKP